MEKVNKTAKELAALYGQFLSELREQTGFIPRKDILDAIDAFIATCSCITVCSWEYDNKDTQVDISDLRSIIMSKLEMRAEK